MATESKSGMVKVRPSNDGSASSSKNRGGETSTGVRKSVDVKQKSITTSSKTEVKGKATSSSKTVTKTVTKTRVKKVFSLPGQKYDPPEEREPLRIFYESLSKQIPSSEMAEFWLMEHGLLSPERAKRAFERKQRKQKQLRIGTPTKSPAPLPPAKPESSKRQQPMPKNGEIKAKKQIANDSDDEDDFVLSHKRRKG